MEEVETETGNEQKTIYDNKLPKIYCSVFGEDDDMDDTPLPYGDKIINANTDEINEAYIDALDTYIGT